MLNVAHPLQQQIDATGSRPLLEHLGKVSPHTLAHSVRLGNAAFQLTRELGFDEQHAIRNGFGTLHHDLGKLDPAITPLIESPFELLKSERVIVDRHAEYGAQNILNLQDSPDDPGLLRSTATVARLHHTGIDSLAHLAPEMKERVLLTQMLDKLDAVTDPNRPYRLNNPMPWAEAVEVALAGLEDVIILGEEPRDLIDLVAEKDLLEKTTKIAA